VTTPSRLDRFIASDPALTRLAVEADRLKLLQAVYRTSVPRTLADASRVAAFERGTVVLFADNNAIAAKLKQLTTRITLHLSSELPEVNGTRVEVQVGGRHKPEKQAQNPHKRSMSQESLLAVKVLHEELPDSPLKRAIGRFLLHHNKI